MVRWHTAAVMVERGCGRCSGGHVRMVVLLVVMEEMRRVRHDDVRRHGRPVRDPVPGRLRGPAAQLAGGAADVHVAAVRVDHPVVALARVVEAPRYLDEALVQRQVVPDAVLPRGRVHPIERELVHDVLVDAAEREPLLRALRYGHHDERVITVVGLLVLVVHRFLLRAVLGAIVTGTRHWCLGLPGLVVVVVVVHHVVAVARRRFLVADAAAVRGHGRRPAVMVVMMVMMVVMVTGDDGRCRRGRAAAGPRAVVDRGAQAVVAAAVAGLAAGRVRARCRRPGALDVRVALVVHVQAAQDVVDGETRSVQRFGHHFGEPGNGRRNNCKAMDPRARGRCTRIYRAQGLHYSNIICENMSARDAP